MKTAKAVLPTFIVSAQNCVTVEKTTETCGFDEKSHDIIDRFFTSFSIISRGPRVYR